MTVISSTYGSPSAAMHSAGIYAAMDVDGPEIGTLVVVMDRAKNLPNLKTMGKQNPYCAARLGKEAKKTDTDLRGGQTPRWDQELRFTVHDSPDYNKLKVSVFNDDKRTDLIGETWVPLDAILRRGGGKADAWHKLSIKGRYAGELRIELTYYDTRPKERQERPQRQSMPASMSMPSLPSLPDTPSPRPGSRQQSIPRRPLPATAGPRGYGVQREAPAELPAPPVAQIQHFDNRYAQRPEYEAGHAHDQEHDYYVGSPYDYPDEHEEQEHDLPPPLPHTHSAPELSHDAHGYGYGHEATYHPQALQPHRPLPTQSQALPHLPQLQLPAPPAHRNSAPAVATAGRSYLHDAQGTPPSRPMHVSTNMSELEAEQNPRSATSATSVYSTHPPPQQQDAWAAVSRSSFSHSQRQSAHPQPHPHDERQLDFYRQHNEPPSQLRESPESYARQHQAPVYTDPRRQHSADDYASAELQNRRRSDAPPVVRPRAISPADVGRAPHPAAYATPRHSASPRHSAGAQAQAQLPQDREQAMPFSPDSFDEINNSSLHATPEYAVAKEPTPMYLTAGEMPKKHNPPAHDPAEPILDAHGRRKDPSDHLPPSSYAPEPERKGDKAKAAVHVASRFGPRQSPAASPLGSPLGTPLGTPLAASPLAIVTGARARGQTPQSQAHTPTQMSASPHTPQTASPLAAKGKLTKAPAQVTTPTSAMASATSSANPSRFSVPPPSYDQRDRLARRSVDVSAVGSASLPATPPQYGHSAQQHPHHSQQHSPAAYSPAGYSPSPLGPAQPSLLNAAGGHGHAAARISSSGPPVPAKLPLSSYASSPSMSGAVTSRPRSGHGLGHGPYGGAGVATGSYYRQVDDYEPGGSMASLAAEFEALPAPSSSAKKAAARVSLPALPHSLPTFTPLPRQPLNGAGRPRKSRFAV